MQIKSGRSLIQSTEKSSCDINAASTCREFIAGNSLKAQIPFILLLITVAYICGGAYVFQKIEKKPDGKNDDKSSKDSALRQSRNCFRTAFKRLDYAAYRSHSNKTAFVLELNDFMKVWKNAGSPTVTLPLLTNEGSTKLGNCTTRYDPWSYGSAVLLTFSIVTTIGYGHVTPITTGGQVFCIFYALIGIPLGILGIANIGRFFSEITLKVYRFIRIKIRQRKQIKLCESGKEGENNATTDASALNDKNGEIVSGATKTQLGLKKGATVTTPPPMDDNLDKLPAPIILWLFAIWILVGSCLLPFWEPMTIWQACYFSFISLTTVGFGDLYPVNYDFFALTYIYLMFGLVLTTMVIDILADYLQKLHYLGRKLTQNFGKTSVWFGSQKMSVSNLLMGVLKQLPIDQDLIDQTILNLDELVENAIQENINPPGPKVESVESEKQSIVSEITHPVMKAFTFNIDFIDEGEDVGNVSAGESHK